MFVLAAAASVKSDKLEDFANFVPTVVVKDVRASWSSDKEADNSPKVSNVEPAVPIILSILSCTNAVVAILVESSVPVCVGAVGLPVNDGESKLAFKSKAVCVAVETGLFASDVLSTLPSPTIPFDTPLTVPVKVGESKLAFKSSAVCVAVDTGLFASDVLSTLPRPT